MEPILSNVPKTIHNEPHDLLSRLYREIGISAVAAALEVSDLAHDIKPSAKDRREALLAAKAA
jgi:hypothetical protein